LNESDAVDFGLAKVIVGYLSASAAALLTSVKLACILGGQMMNAFSGSFFR
jgi:hypothetical protein